MGGLPRHNTPAAGGAAPTPPASPAASRPAAERIKAIRRGLAAHWPDAVVEIDHQDAYQLLVGTILAAQSSDKVINTVTPALFARYPDARALAGARPAELEVLIYKTGFFRMKARSLMGMARAVVERHGGEIPRTMAELVELPGVGRKTANVLLGSVWGLNEGIVVDLHVTRLAARLALSAASEPTKIERDLMALVPRAEWTVLAHRVIWHGRRICLTRAPLCDECRLAPVCPSASCVAAKR